MSRLAKLQFFGPVAVFLTVGAAEAAAFALARIPTSETLWYINLKIFDIFQKSHYLLNTPLNLPYSQFFLIALPLFAIATYGLLANRAFPLALASHLSFIYTAFLLYSLVSSQTSPLTASLSSIIVATSTNIYLPLILAGASIISFLVSHYQYLLGFFDINSKSMPRANNP
jgi:hypothetical protein